MDRGAVRGVAALLLDTLLEHDWPLDAVSQTRCEQELAAAGGADSVLLRHALQRLGGVQEGDTWRLDARAVAREAARGVLRRHVQESGSARMPEKDFLSAWALRVPGSEPAPPALELLQGVAVRETAADEKIATPVGRAISFPCFLFLCAEDLSAASSEVCRLLVA